MQASLAPSSAREGRAGADVTETHISKLVTYKIFCALRVS
jgi:hypothetical protein